MIPVKLKHFEEGSSWTEKRSGTSMSTTAAVATVSSGGGTKCVSVCILDLSNGQPPTAEMETLNDILLTSSPSFVFVHDATQAVRQQIMQLQPVRKLYAITDLVRYEPRDAVDKGAVALVRLGVTCDVVDNATKQLEGTCGGIVRLFETLQVRSFAGASLTVAALYVDPSATTWQRMAAVTGVLPLLENAELVIFCTNVFSFSGALNAEMRAACAAKGFVDAAEETGERHGGSSSNNNNSSHQEWVVWVKSLKFVVTNFTHGSTLPEMASPQVTIATLGPRTATTITIPQPRSAKCSNPRGSPASLVSPPIMTDPAILSAEAACKGGVVMTKGCGSVIVERLLHQEPSHGAPHWRASHSYTLKSNEKLNSNESAFDLSAHFSSVQDAVDALNSKAIYWPAEFCVVQNVILVSNTVGQCDKRAMFRRYAKEYKNSAALLSQMFLHAGNSKSNNNTSSIIISSTAVQTTTTTNSSPGVVSEKTSWLKRVTTLSAHSKNENNAEDTTATSVSTSIIPLSRAFKREEEFRSRTWDISWCTVVYQVTPREMKFNITPAVGLGKDNLSEAIQCLNLRSQSKAKVVHAKENPLQNYAYDYALLFSVELQGYWLIAATDVPCDIVACRAAA